MPAKRRMIADMNRSSKANIVRLEETKISSPMQGWLSQLGGILITVIMNAQGVSGGIIIGFNRNVFNLEESRQAQFSLSIKLAKLRDQWEQVIIGYTVQTKEGCNPAFRMILGSSKTSGTYLGSLGEILMSLDFKRREKMRMVMVMIEKYSTS